MNAAVKAAVENLESRQLLSYTTHFRDPSQGMIDSETPTAAYRADQIEVPQVSSDGTITVNGTSVDDVITVTRVDNPLADKDDGEYDFARYLDANGQAVWESGGLDQYVSADWLTDERAEMAYYERDRDAAIADGRPVPDYITEQLARFDERISRGETFLNKFETGHFIRITLEGVYDWFYEISDEQAANSKIVINGGAGKDNINIATNVPLKATINGDAGSDTLTSGKKLARLNGGGGNDRLISRSLKGGSMAGGAGADRYYNRIAGTEMDVAARSDGDQVATAAGLVAVKQGGVFGILSTGAKAADRSSSYYYVVDGKEGSKDLLA
jgi:Ca2+-binding RTX toxin-like protein